MEIEYEILKPYIPAINTDKRYVLVGGGRAGGRSYWGSQYALDSLTTKEYFRCAIMRYIQGDIRDSIRQEIIDRIEEREWQKYITIKDTRIVFRGNSIISKGFKKSSSDQKAKLKSLAGFTDIIIEEAEEVSEEDFIQLDDSLRTVKGNIRIILLFNFPPKDHWINKRWFDLTDSEVPDFYEPKLKESVKHNTLYIFSDYHDNIKNLDKQTVNNYESYKITNPDHYWNMIRGLVPTGKRGIIHKNWIPMSDVDFDALPYPSFYGLDFGFSNDPTALIEVKKHNNRVYFREKIYKTGLTNQDISNEMDILDISKTAYIYCDSAEPKSIEELRRLGWNAVPADKGQGSVNAGLSKLLEKECYYTDTSANLIKEKENYCWALDKDKNPTNNPIDDFNHCFAGSSLVHTTKGRIPIKNLVGTTGYLYSLGGSIQEYSDVRPTRYNVSTLKIEFTDGNVLEVTPDHFILKANGEWTEAHLLSPKDLIQSVMYENTDISGKGIQVIPWRKLLQSWWETITQGYMGILQWANPKRYAHTPQKWGQRKQQYREFGVDKPTETSDETYDKGEDRKTEKMGGKNKTSDKKMASFQRRGGMAQITRYRSIQKKTTIKEKLCSLPQRIYNYKLFKNCPFLPSELQNESSYKEIKRITRGFCDVVYNMEVKNTECLLVDGVIAHNCMDAGRYAVYTDSTQKLIGFF